MLSPRRSARGECGQVVVFFALLIPVIFGIGAIVLDVGNWYVHKRHIQTQVDAAVLATAPGFSGCFHSIDGASINIANTALAYAGDTLRDPNTTNLQVQEPGDVRVVLNSDTYWQTSDGLVPGTPGLAGAGYGLDYDPNYPDGNPLTPGDPCSTSTINAKATDDAAPPLWGLIPFTPSPKTRATVEIQRVPEQNGFLPFAVPEIDPAGVVAIFIDDDTGAIVDWQRLAENTSYDNDGNPTTPFPFAAWTTQPLEQQVCVSCNATSPRTSVVILVSKDNTSPSIDASSLQNTCTQAPSLIKCYGGYTNGSGLSMIGGFQPAGTGGVGGSAIPPGVPTDAPIVRGVSLFALGCSTQSDLSAPYFTLQGDCDANITALIDMGVSGATNPTTYPYCAEINNMTFDENVVVNGQSLSSFTGSVALPAGGGRQTVSLSGVRHNRNTANSTCRNTVDVTYSFPNPVAAGYVADDASGPVEYLRLTAKSFTGDCTTGGSPIGDANSVPKGNYCYHVAVGLQKPLRLVPATDDPFLLRFASKSGSLNQALDCDHSPLKLSEEVRDGCQTYYSLNYDDFDKNPLTPYTWADITCSAYGLNDLPPTSFVNDPTPNCISAKTGDVQDMQKGLHDRFEAPCTPNYWPEADATVDEVKDFFVNHDFVNDKRFITLIITDITAFSGSGAENVPVKYFAGFDATGWDTGGPHANGCGRGDQYLIDDVLQGLPANLNANDCHPLLATSTNPAPSRSEPCTAYQKSKDNGDVWGHFVKFVVFSSNGRPSGDRCVLTSDDPQTCVAVLVE
jgi:Flp pilus assembly protein TadG